MKKQILSVAVFLFGALAILGSCKKSDSGSPDNGLSPEINNIISQDILNNLTNRGMVINKGTTPPNVTGIYLVNPFVLQSPYGPDDPWTAGQVIPDYKYKLYDQSGTTVKLDYKSTTGVDDATGLGSFISGSDKKFSLFAEVSGTASGITYKSVSIISGEMTEDGIKDFQYAFVYTEKNGDPNDNVLIPVGEGRIWRDGDAMAAITAVYLGHVPAQLNPAEKGAASIR